MGYDYMLHTIKAVGNIGDFIAETPPVSLK